MYIFNFDQSGWRQVVRSTRAVLTIQIKTFWSTPMKSWGNKSDLEIKSLNTVKPVLTATSEQRPPVYNGQLEPQFSKIL